VAVSRATIQNVERGRSAPRPATMRRIAEALGTDVTGLTSEDAPPPEPTTDELKRARRVLIEAMRLDSAEEMRDALADAIALVTRAMEHQRDAG
jgi:transcriptional regulator with XRE-family HTH domain